MGCRGQKAVCSAYTRMVALPQEGLTRASLHDYRLWYILEALFAANLCHVWAQPNRSMGRAAQHPRLRLEGIYQLLQCRIRYRFSNTHSVTSPAVFDRDGIRAHVCGPTR